MLSVRINKVIETGDKKYDVYVEINYKERIYELYLPKLSRKPSYVESEISEDKLYLRLINDDKGICTCQLDLKDIEKGCILLSCKPSAIWVTDSELIKSHRVYQVRKA